MVPPSGLAGQGHWGSLFLLVCLFFRSPGGAGTRSLVGAHMALARGLILTIRQPPLTMAQSSVRLGFIPDGDCVCLFLLVICMHQVSFDSFHLPKRHWNDLGSLGIVSGPE
ncbi:hypothetical protein V8C26DRAFT_417160 [Trichoderma gracile]